MLMLIQKLSTGNMAAGRISIHLMLMLIEKHADGGRQRERYFNTSHVNVNLSDNKEHQGFILISIHLMLMLIGIVSQDYRCVVQFQYISC